MVRLKRHKPTVIRLKASSLVEVLIAMVILLSIFGIGMMIFANLDRSSSSLESRIVRGQLSALAEQYKQTDIQDSRIQIDSIAYYIEEIPIEGIQDRIRLKIYAERLLDGTYIDSLIMIRPLSKTPKT